MIAERSTFARVKAALFLDTEEVRYDIPAVLASGQIYVGVAPAGTAEGEPKWGIVRTDLDSAGNPTRDRFRKAIRWDQRTTGW